MREVEDLVFRREPWAIGEEGEEHGVDVRRSHFERAEVDRRLQQPRRGPGAKATETEAETRQRP